MRPSTIFSLLLLFVSSGAYANVTEAFSSFSDQSKRTQEIIGSQVTEIEFIGESVSDQVKSRFLSMRGREYRPNSVRNAIEWFHENGGDSLLEVFAHKNRNGISLFVKVKEKVRVKSIGFSGNSVVTSNALQALIDLKEGGDYDSTQANSAALKISNFYTTQGYLASDVKLEFNAKNKELNFRITEGDPTLVGLLEISPLTSIEETRLRVRYEREIAEAFGLKIGDRVQRERVLEGIQRVKDWLREHDFLTAKDPELEYGVSEDGKVKIGLNISYGPRIRFGFRGNFLFSYRELIAFVWEVKEVSSGGDYIASIRRRILEAYREIGHGNAAVSTLVKEDSSKGIRYVSLIVDEGQKTKIEKINIEGVFSMEARAAKEKFYSLATRLVQRDFFHESGVNKAAELFAEHLRSNGYLSAKLEFTKFDFNEDRSKVKIALLFNEGVQTRVSEIKINGLKSLSEQEILSLLSIELEKPFDIFSFERGLIAIKDKYQNLGHLSAQVSNEGSESIVRYSRDNSQVQLQLDIDEGPLFKVGEILVRGNKQTHARVVLRELPFITNDVLTRPLLNEAEDNLRKLNLFASVIVRPIDRPGDENVKDILILIEETEPGSFEIAPGYRNDLGLRLSFGVAYQNLGGWNRTVNAQAVFNRRTENYRFPEYNFSVGFREPYLANWPVVFTTNLNLLRRQYSAFSANVSRSTTAVKRDLSRVLSGFLEYGYERVQISDVNTNRTNFTKADERTDFIGSLTPGLIFDSRNDKYNPTTGFYSINRFEVASRFFGSENSVGFIRTSSNNSYYWTIYDRFVLALAMNLGFERSSVVNSPIPIFKLFRLGGVGSIRGYSEDEIEVESQKNITGSLGSVNYRAELRIPLGGSLGSALFMDAGNLLIDRFQLSPRGLRSAAGAGLRYVTPVGPVLLDFAWRLQTDSRVGDILVEGTDRFKIHFAIGAF
jgi:outer membrane protein insertion porin family